MKQKRKKQLPLKRVAVDVKTFLRKDKEETHDVAIILRQVSSPSSQC